MDSPGPVASRGSEEVSDPVGWYPPVMIPRRIDCPGKSRASSVNSSTPLLLPASLIVQLFILLCNWSEYSLAPHTRLSSHSQLNPDPRSRVNRRLECCPPINIQSIPSPRRARERKQARRGRLISDPRVGLDPLQGETKRFNDVIASRLPLESSPACRQHRLELRRSRSAGAETDRPSSPVSGVVSSSSRQSPLSTGVYPISRRLSAFPPPSPLSPLQSPDRPLICSQC